MIDSFSWSFFNLTASITKKCSTKPKRSTNLLIPSPPNYLLPKTPLINKINKLQ